AHYLLGKAYLEAQKPELALMEYKTVNNLGIFTGLCRETPFRKEIADLYMQFHQFDEALKEYLLLVNAEPGVAEHYFHVGDLFEERSRTDKAELYFQKSIELDPEFAEAYSRLGKILYRQKKPLEARMALEKAIKYNTDNTAAYFYLGKLMKEGHDYVGALINFEKAEKDFELKLKVLVERGTCYMSMNNYENAIAEFERAIRAAQDDGKSEIVYARYFLGLCYEKTRQFELAVDNWEKVYAKRPQFRDVAEKLSQYQELRTDDRIKDFLTASQPRFIEICQDIVVALRLEVRDVSELPNGCQILAVEAESKWRGARKMPKLIRIFRIPDLIDDSSVRALHEAMKKINVTRGLIITSSSFSRKAYEFAETRPIDLFNKEKLRELLATAEREHASPSR
ncbi:MAG TPA: tetratricopeptide repeat protein, partial [Spirochaetia bacterium]|nr:tetratricopeptide repeat protein [Spirochaetia bacterium]